MSPKKLSEEQIQSRLAGLPHWKLIDGPKLSRQLQFADFVQAFGFLSQVALVAESLNHHPEITNVYNRVGLHLNTHDVGGLSEADFQLATRVDQIASRMGL